MTAVVSGHDELANADDDELPPRRHRRRRWIVLAVLTVAVLVTVVLTRSGRDSVSTPAEAVARGEAQVELRTLAETEEVDGTLGFTDRVTLTAGDAGIITALTEEGMLVERGGTLYALDDNPVVLLIGDLPMFRQLVLGVADGSDIRQLEQNLVDLGHDHGSITVDETFTAATTAAVRRWQSSLGLDDTGIVDSDDVIFVSAARAGEHAVEEGSRIAAGDAVVDVTADRMDADGANQRRVTPEAGQFVAWSPDGRYLLISGRTLYVLRPDGTGRVELRATDTSMALGGLPDWSA